MAMLSYFGEQLTWTLVEDWTQKHLHDDHGLQPLGLLAWYSPTLHNGWWVKMTKHDGL
jgi:hypothetical protein